MPELKVSKYKDWSNADYELECLGHRIDSARAAIRRTRKNTWARQHWQTTLENLRTRWHMTIKLKDSGLRQERREPSDIVKWDWWEDSDEVAELRLWPFNILQDISDERRIQAGLQASWENRRNEIVRKARQGLA